MINPKNQKLLDKYLMVCKNKGLTPKSIKAFKIDISLFLNFIGDKEVLNTTNIDIEDFFFYCLNERHNGDWAMSRKHTSLNGFYTNMIKRDYLEMKNPLDKVDKAKVRKKQRGHLNDEEMDVVFKYLEKNDKKRDLAIFSLIFASGIRLSELRQLNRDTLDFETKRFKVLGKGEKERICIFDNYAKENILTYLKSRNDDIYALFISRQHNRISERAVQMLIKNNIKRAGINKNMTTHHIRHSCAMHYLRMGMPLNLIQKILGHNSIATTQIYAHDSIDDVQEYLEKY